LRHTRALTQDGLAKAAAVPRSTIANLESGDGNPSLAVLVKVAGALAVPIDELLASPRAMVRRWPADEVATRTKGRGVSIRALVPEPVPDEMMEVMDFAPAAVMGGTPHLPGTREFFTRRHGGPCRRTDAEDAGARLLSADARRLRGHGPLRRRHRPGADQAAHAHDARAGEAAPRSLVRAGAAADLGQRVPGQHGREARA